MKANLFCLLLLLTLFSCANEEQKLYYEQLNNNLIGEWYLADIPAAEETWFFHEDGTYEVRMGQTEDHGSWELDKDILVLDGDNKNKEIIIIENGQLNWGNYHFKKAGNTYGSSNQSNLANDLIGAWELDSEQNSSTYEFFSDGTYELIIGKQINAINYSGSWAVEDQKLILDGQKNSAKRIAIKDNTLIWQSSSYSRLKRTPLKDDFLANRLLGQWYSDEIGHGITYTFEKEGQFKSFDGRYTSKGKWAIEGTELIIDNYKAAATPIRISDYLLRWDGVTYLKLDKGKLPNWTFEKTDQKIQANYKGNTKIIREDKSSSEESTFHKISSRVGPYVAIQTNQQPTAQVAQNYYEVYNAASMKKVKLNQLFSEGELLDAFLKSKTVQTAIDGEEITDLEDLLLSIPSDCNLLLADHLLTSFTFYNLRSTSVEVRVAIPSNCKNQGKAKTNVFKLRLPIPEAFSSALKSAKKAKHLVKN